MSVAARLEPHSNLISGPTAYALLRLRYALTTVASLLAVTALILMNTGVPQSIYTDWLIYIWFIFNCSIGIDHMYLVFRTSAERRAGYTTLWKELQELEQRDPHLGLVIRQPREEYLSRTDFRSRIQATRTEARRRGRKA